MNFVAVQWLTTYRYYSTIFSPLFFLSTLLFGKVFALSGLRRYESDTCPPFLSALSNQPSQRPLNRYEQVIASAWEGVCKQQLGVSLRIRDWLS